MNETRTIRFFFAGINTEEFAILSDAYDRLQEAKLNANMAFRVNVNEKILAMQVKFVTMQQEKTLAVIAVSCQFRIVPEDWQTLYSEETHQLMVPKLTALHFASLTVSTARGVFHAKTEKLSINALIIPPINVNDFVKSDLVLNGPEMTPAR